MNPLPGDRTILCFPAGQHFTDKPAEKENLIFLKNDRWLANAAVIDSINYKNGDCEFFSATLLKKIK
jgi:hypothetical protein